MSKKNKEVQVTILTNFDVLVDGWKKDREGYLLRARELELEGQDILAYEKEVDDFIKNDK